MISTKSYPAEFSETQAASFISESPIKGRKALGQFFTPLSVARFMAGPAEYKKETLRVLDAGTTKKFFTILSSRYIIRLRKI